MRSEAERKRIIEMARFLGVMAAGVNIGVPRRRMSRPAAEKENIGGKCRAARENGENQWRANDWRRRACLCVAALKYAVAKRGTARMAGYHREAASLEENIIVAYRRGLKP